MTNDVAKGVGVASSSSFDAAIARALASATLYFATSGRPRKLSPAYQESLNSGVMDLCVWSSTRPQQNGCTSIIAALSPVDSQSINQSVAAEHAIVNLIRVAADEWEHRNAFSSRAAAALADPVLDRVRFGGDRAIRLAWERLLSDRAPLWIAFLNQSTAGDPARGTETIEDAAAKWREWGIRLGFKE